jgi:predicted phosphodiesterase
MRIALLSDIHGNATALEAVLANVAQAGGVDEYWVLGDLVALGPEPVAVLERLVALPRARFIRGNTDRYLVTGERPPPTAEQVASDPGLLPRYAEVAATFAWTQGALVAGGWLDWLRALPTELRLTFPNGTRLLGVHSTPHADDDTGFLPSLSEAEMRALLAGCDAELIVAGHTHLALKRQMAGGVVVVNLGSVSNPLPPDLRASYGLLEANEDGFELGLHQAEYDREAVIARLQRQGHPGADFIIRHLRGEHNPYPPEVWRAVN